MALYRQYVFFLFLQLSVLPTAAETLTIRHFPFEGEKEKYMEGLVELALSYSDLDVQFEVNSALTIPTLIAAKWLTPLSRERFLLCGRAPPNN